MQDDDPAELPFALAIGGLAPILVGALLVTVRADVVNANMALILMGVVVMVAAVGGRAAACVAAVIAAASFDFFLTQPYLSMRINSSDDVETATVLLLVGLAVGDIAARARRSRAAAEQGRSEIRRIHHLAEMVARGEPEDAIIDAACGELVGLLQLQDCRFEREPVGLDIGKVRARLERNGAIARHEAAVVHLRYTRGGFELPEEGVELAVLSRGREVGWFVMEPTPGVGASLEQRVVAVALADQVGAALS